MHSPMGGVWGAPERDSGAMSGTRVEAVLLAALDREADGSIAAQLRATLRTLLHAGAPSQPVHWLATFCSVALASAPAGAAPVGPAARGLGRSGGADLDQGLMADAGARAWGGPLPGLMRAVHLHFGQR